MNHYSHDHDHDIDTHDHATHDHDHDKPSEAVNLHSHDEPHDHSHSHESHDHIHDKPQAHDHSHDGPGCACSHEPQDPEVAAEFETIMSTLGAYHLYRRTAHNKVTHSRRVAFHALPLKQQEILNKAPINFSGTLNAIDQAIEHNAELSEAIFAGAIQAFGIDPAFLQGKEWLDSVTTENLDKVRSTLKQFYRDWSAEGACERKVCYGPVMTELERRYGHLSTEQKGNVLVLVPGAGLGRLAFDIAVAGYTSQGNENSYHQLMASNYILNCTTSANQHTLHPFYASFSNHRARSGQLQAVTIPDVHPPSLLADASKDDRFSMAAGDFVAAYNTPEANGTFDVVATVFFIDTAVNIFSYLETIWNALADGGVWINYGPLLWHWENQKADLKASGEAAQGMELTVDEVLAVAATIGFRLEKRERGQKGEYINSGEDNMLSWVYEGEFWVMIKDQKKRQELKVESKPQHEATPVSVN